MKKRLISILLCLTISSTALTGCSFSSLAQNVKETISGKEEKPKDYDETLKGESSTTTVNESELTNGEFYVVHNDKFYSIWQYSKSFDEYGSGLEKADGTRHVFFDLDQENSIPTLYLKNGDKLIYYSEDTLLDSITFERFKDDGYTIGLYGFSYLTGDKPYIDIEENGLDKTTVPTSDLYNQLKELKIKHNLLIDKINDTKVSNDYINNGIIYGLKPNEEYNVQLYEGTIYHNIKTKADIHSFTSMEIFKSINYTPLDVENEYEIEIPSYLKTGYYFINGCGLIRLVIDGDSYKLSDKDSFNNLILETGEDDDGNIVLPKVYSECDELNIYESLTPGAIGYKEEDGVVDKKDNNTSAPKSIDSTNTIYYKIKTDDNAGNIYFSSQNTSGNVILYCKGKKTYATYNNDEGRYEIELTSSNLKDSTDYALAISGFDAESTVDIPSGWTIEKTTKDDVSNLVSGSESEN